ncbi:MAG: hypothetical protein H6772_04565 [Pseudomonadales bacterium]|nr:hypothetical protein [Pseudomonadales bacterium]
MYKVYPMIPTKNQQGQIAIVILLIMVVLLTIGLSLASRTTQEVFLSQQEAESTRVFNAAESGVEDALSQDFSAMSGTQNLPNVGIDNVTTNTTIIPQGVIETQITEGTSVHLDLTGIAGGSPITIEWSKNSDCDNSASLIATTYYDDAGETKVVHDPFGPELPCTSPRDVDDFTREPSVDAVYKYKHTLNLPTGIGVTPLFMRIKAVYADTPLRVTGAEATNQYFIIRAEANNDLGDESRTIEVGRGLSTAPSFMDYALYSGGTLGQ